MYGSIQAGWAAFLKRTRPITNTLNDNMYEAYCQGRQDGVDTVNRVISELQKESRIPLKDGVDTVNRVVSELQKESRIPNGDA